MYFDPTDETLNGLLPLLVRVGPRSNNNEEVLYTPSCLPKTRNFAIKMQLSVTPPIPFFGERNSFILSKVRDHSVL